MTWNDIIFMLPEIVIAIGASLMLVMPVTGLRTVISAKWAMMFVLAVTAASLIWSSWTAGDIAQTHYFARMFALDAFSIFFKLLFIGAIVVVVLLSDDYFRETRYSTWEYYSLLGFALCGMMFMA